MKSVHDDPAYAPVLAGMQKAYGEQRRQYRRSPATVPANRFPESWWKQRHEQKAALAVAQTNFEWARLRMNQLEGERSQLFAHVLKIPLAPMVVDREPAPSLGSGLPIGLGADVSFEDMGDDMAKSMGLQDA